MDRFQQPVQPGDILGLFGAERVQPGLGGAGGVDATLDPRAMKSAKPKPEEITPTDPTTDE